MHNIKKKKLSKTVGYPAVRSEDIKTCAIKSQSQSQGQSVRASPFLGRYPCSQLVTHCSALAGCPLRLAQQPLLALRQHCIRQQ